VYKEKISINRNNVKLIGESRQNTIITFDDYAKKLGEDGKQLGTFRSYTMYIKGEDFVVENISFINSAGSGRVVGQAIAVYVDADRAIFKNCHFYGHQDTLCTAPLPSDCVGEVPNGGSKPKELIINRNYFLNCFIQGSVDFIFGGATAVFHKCEIIAIDIEEKVKGFIAAACTNKNNPFGYVFLDCEIKSNLKEECCFLARPWRQYAKTVFLNCHIDSFIFKEGYSMWGDRDKETNCFYADFNTTGKGANDDFRVSFTKKLTEEEAYQYTLENIFNFKDYTFIKKHREYFKNRLNNVEN
jgi:pectinesterase